MRGGRAWIAPLWVVLAAGLLTLPARADDGGEGRVRRWALGWEDGITLRHSLGAWDLSVSAGPDDWLDETDVYAWDESWPDTAQGRLTDGDDTRRESGYVRLGGGRQLSAWRDFSLHATLAGTYDWTSAKDTWHYFYVNDPGRDSRTTEWHEDRWVLQLGLRLAWRPVPVLGIQTRLGLRLTSASGERTTTRYDASQDEWEGTSAPYRTVTFGEYGSYGTGSLEFFFWF